MTDPSWFYFSLAQVTGAIVGFVGGFLILRIAHSLHNFQTIIDRFNEAQLAWAREKSTQELVLKRHMPVMPDSEIRVTASLADMEAILKRREDLQVPVDVAVVTWLLMLLLAVGCLAPLMTLGSPSNWIQAAFLTAFAAVIVVFVLILRYVLRLRLKEAKGLEPMEQVLDALKEWGNE